MHWLIKKIKIWTNKAYIYHTSFLKELLSYHCDEHFSLMFKSFSHILRTFITQTTFLKFLSREFTEELVLMNQFTAVHKVELEFPKVLFIYPLFASPVIYKGHIVRS